MESMHDIVFYTTLFLRKQVFGVSDQVWQKLGCAVTKDD